MTPRGFELDGLRSEPQPRNAAGAPSALLWTEQDDLRGPSAVVADADRDQHSLMPRIQDQIFYPRFVSMEMLLFAVFGTQHKALEIAKPVVNDFFHFRSLPFPALWPLPPNADADYP